MSLLLFLTFFPVIVILMFVYAKDINKEPISLLIKLFFLGIVSCYMVIIVSEIMGLFLPFMNEELSEMDFGSVFLYAFIGVALVEEGCKWLMVYKGGYNNDEFDEIYDIMVYSVFVSLGFACFENIVYVIPNTSVLTALVRGVSAIPVHACTGIFMGYYLSIAKQFHYKKRYDLEKRNIFFSVLVPTLLHGLYDFCIMSKMITPGLIFFGFVLVLYINSFKRLKKMATDNRKIKFKNKYCPMCGAKIEGLFCSNCGLRQE